MSADGVRGLSTNASKVEKVVRQRSVSGYKRRTRRAAQEVLARIRFDCDKLTNVRRLKDRRQPLLIRVLSTLDEIVVRGCWI
jgi:hypothetical protein